MKHMTIKFPGGLPVTMHSKVEGHSVFTMGRGEAFQSCFQNASYFAKKTYSKYFDTFQNLNT